MTYREQQLEEENRVLYLNLLWLAYVQGRIKDDTLIDEDADKDYGWIDYKEIEIINFSNENDSFKDKILFEDKIMENKESAAAFLSSI